MINMNSKMKVTDRDSVCRLCLCHSGSFLDIFLVNDCFGQLVADAIAGLLQIEVTKTDIFPKVICVPCFKKIVEFEDFKKKCLQSKDTFSQEFVNSEKNEVCQETFGETTVVRDKLEELLDVHSYAKSSTSSGDAVVSSGIDSSHYLKQVSNRKDTELSGLNLNRAFVTTPQNTKMGEKYHQENASHKNEMEPKDKTSTTISDKGEESLGEEASCLKRSDDLKNDDRKETWDDVLEDESHEEDAKEEMDSISDEEDSENDEDEEVEGEDYEEFERECVEEFGSYDESNDSDLDIELDCNYFMRQTKRAYRTFVPPPFGSTNEHYPISCPDCRMAFRNKQALGFHQMVHSKPLTYYCNLCEGQFIVRDEYMSHRKMHQKEKRHVCDTCGKRYCTKTGLNWHKNTHLPFKSFLCNYCGKSFHSYPLLKNHFGVHRDEKPFTCEVCGKSFRQKSNLKVHFRVHSNERPYKCHLCEKAYKRKSILVDHLESHANERRYACEECGKSFNTAYRRGEHKQSVHNKGEPVSCEVCDKTFSCLKYLQKHKVTHEKREKKKRIRKKKEQVVEVSNKDVM